jgi:hypothetical protein
MVQGFLSDLCAQHHAEDTPQAGKFSSLSHYFASST